MARFTRMRWSKRISRPWLWSKQTSIPKAGPRTAMSYPVPIPTSTPARWITAAKRDTPPPPKTASRLSNTARPLRSDTGSITDRDFLYRGSARDRERPDAQVAA
ncbi:MAG: hypothetical protein [Caudoviricetes sp.]|nr:MAG: hypothetical protein [Caudoviricetes sp.]